MLFSKIVCFFIGHKSVPMYIEEDGNIYQNGCNRCGTSMGMPAMWANMPRYPGTSQEEWNLFLENKKTELKKEVAIKVARLSLPIIKDLCYHPLVDRTTSPPMDDDISISDFRVGFEYEELQPDSERFFNKGDIWVKKTYGLKSPRLFKIQKLIEECKIRNCK